MLLGGIFAMVTFIVSARRLYTSANKKYSFDQFVLVSESFKLFLFLISQFVYLHQSMLVVVQIFQSLI